MVTEGAVSLTHQGMGSPAFGHPWQWGNAKGKDAFFPLPWRPHLCTQGGQCAGGSPTGDLTA